MLLEFCTLVTGHCYISIFVLTLSQIEHLCSPMPVMCKSSTKSSTAVINNTVSVSSDRGGGAGRGRDRPAKRKAGRGRGDGDGPRRQRVNLRIGTGKKGRQAQRSQKRGSLRRRDRTAEKEAKEEAAIERRTISLPE